MSYVPTTGSNWTNEIVKARPVSVLTSAIETERLAASEPMSVIGMMNSLAANGSSSSVSETSVGVAVCCALNSGPVDCLDSRALGVGSAVDLAPVPLECDLALRRFWVGEPARGSSLRPNESVRWRGCVPWRGYVAAYAGVPLEIDLSNGYGLHACDSWARDPFELGLLEIDRLPYGSHDYDRHDFDP